MAFNKYPHVYQPIQVGPMTLKNRIQWSPIVSNHCGVEDGLVTPEMLEFTASQAKSGAALITIGSTPIDFDRGRDFYACLSVTKAEDEGGLSLLTREVHKYGAKLSTELIHAGQWAHPRSLTDGKRAWVPSYIPGWHDRLLGRDKIEEISRPQMLEVIDHYQQAVKRCMDTGFDMVMVHLAHGNLLSSFLSTAFNRRNDSYGGSAKNRWKFPLEVIEAMYDVTKGKIPIEARVVGNEYFEGGTDVRERIEFLKEAQKYIDMIIISAGTLYNEYAMGFNMPGYYAKPGLNVPYAQEMKAALDIPVSVVGGISTLDEAEEIIASGKADIVAMAKAFLADPALVVKGERGREDDIRPCMRCLYCLRNPDESHIDGCAVNPAAGWEYKYTHLAPAMPKKKVMIIGGGPGGMKAARLLAKRGHEAVLYEKSDKLGGRLAEASALFLKDGFRRYYDYAVRKTLLCGARIEFGTEADVAAVKAEAPDALIIACGGELIAPKIEGADLPLVSSVVCADRKKKSYGDKIVVCGAGLSGSECALEFAHEGKAVCVVDIRPVDELYGEMPGFARRMLIDRLAEEGVKVYDRHAVKRFTGEGVIVEDAYGKESLLAADDIVLAFGVRPDTDKIAALSGLVPETYVIGDARATGQIGDAVADAFNVCVAL
ncbi:MAG: FAD-dependent oxidoreductase [Clostridiales Family XIII bacterium]|nr:FAD-dependent oxidoreductase [Clostridiales Family XIII bacterium]